MDMVHAYNSMKRLEKLHSQWEKQGLTDEQKKVRLNTYLDETKRKHLADK